MLNSFVDGGSNFPRPVCARPQISLGPDFEVAPSQCTANSSGYLAVGGGIREEDSSAFKESVQFVELRFQLFFKVDFFFGFPFKRFDNSILIVDVP